MKLKKLWHVSKTLLKLSTNPLNLLINNQKSQNPLPKKEVEPPVQTAPVIPPSDHGLGALQHKDKAVITNFESTTANHLKQMEIDVNYEEQDHAPLADKVEKTITAEHDKLLLQSEHEQALLKQMLLQEKEVLETALEQVKSKEEFGQELQAKKQQTLHEAAQKTVKQLSGKKTISVNEDLVKKEELLRQCKEKKKQKSAVFHDLFNHHYQRIAPEKKLIHRKGVFWAIVSFLFMMEISINFSTFQTINIGDNNLGALFLGLFFAMGQAWTAKKTGAAFYERHKKALKMFAGLTLTFCLLISSFRFFGDIGFFNKIIYLIINVLIGLVTVILAYFHSKDQKFFTLQNELDQLSTKIRVLEQQIADDEANYKERFEGIELEYEKKAENLTKKAKEKAEEKLRHVNHLLQTLETHQQWVKSALHKIHENGVVQCQKLAQQPKNNSTAKRSHLRPKYPPRQSAVGLLLLLWLGFSSCSHPPATTIEVIYDQTGETEPMTVEPMVDYILGYTDFVETHPSSWGETTIHLSPIGEVSSQAVQTIHLPASKFYWLRNHTEDKKAIASFKASLHDALVTLTEPSEEKNHSYIHRNFFYRLAPLAEIEGKKVVLSWSDLISNDGKVNHYQYKKQPHLIEQHRDSLIQLMTDDYMIPPLEGVTLINFHQPNTQTDELHEYCKRYFAHYWQHLGMEVTFKTNLPQSPVLSANSNHH